MYSDTDRQGLVSIFEMDKPEATVLLKALEEAIKVWKLELKKYQKYSNRQLEAAELMRKLQYRQSLANARKLHVAISAAIKNIDTENNIYYAHSGICEISDP